LIKIYLASGSPRRQDILNKFGISFKLTSHSFDETSLNPKAFNSVAAYVKSLAKSKALSVQHIKKDWVLAADTIVVHNNNILNKPPSYDAAIAYLSQLSNSKHSVLSAICMYNPKTKRCFTRCEKATIIFNPLTNKEIQTYVYEKHPLDKAGGYGLQEIPHHFIKSVSGSKYTVIGLPIHLLKKVIKHIHSNTL
jgi:septum formation protein